MPSEYKDQDGNPVTLDKLCRMEPEWAANRIRRADARVVELELRADMYWDWDDTEVPIDSLSDHVAELETEGVVYRLMRAKKLPDLYIETEMQEDRVGDFMGYKVSDHEAWKLQRDTPRR